MDAVAVAVAVAECGETDADGECVIVIVIVREVADTSSTVAATSISTAAATIMSLLDMLGCACVLGFSFGLESEGGG